MVFLGQCLDSADTPERTRGGQSQNLKAAKMHDTRHNTPKS